MNSYNSNKVQSVKWSEHLKMPLETIKEIIIKNWKKCKSTRLTINSIQVKKHKIMLKILLDSRGVRPSLLNLMNWSSLLVDSVATKTCRNTALIDRLGGTKKRRTASQTSATHSFDTVTSTWATLPAWSSPLSLTDATSPSHRSACHTVKSSENI